MINLIGTALNQWDVGRSVTVTESEATHVHFANLGDTKAVIMELVESQSKIPDYLLQTGKQLCVYAVANGVTIERRTFPVTKRERPEDYVYEDDQRNYIYEFLHSVAGKKTEEGGEIFNDYTTNKATAKFATAFGSENTAAGECAIAGGKRIFKSGAECVSRQDFNGETGDIVIAYVADPNGEYAKNNPLYEEGLAWSGDITFVDGIYECWWGVEEWRAWCEEFGFPIPDMLMLEDGRFALTEDLRFNEAYGTGAMAIGKGAVAFSRASKSFGYRTQTGYPPSEEHAAARPEAIVQTDENGNPTYPSDNVGQGAFAIGADTAALNNHDFAGGWGSIAKGWHSFSFGGHCESSANYAASFGNYSKASGYAAFAIGDHCESSAENTFSGGFESKASSGNSIAFGYGCKASTRRTVALGSEANASGEMGAAAIGHQVTAYGKGATAMGSGTNAKGEGSFAVGAGSQATSYGAFAYGDHCVASNYNAIAGGANSKAEQANTGAIGRRLVTGRSSQFVVGQDNVKDASALFVVGNGTSDTNRKNAFVVNADGSVVIPGNLIVNGQDIKSMIDNAITGAIGGSY